MADWQSIGIKSGNYNIEDLRTFFTRLVIAQVTNEQTVTEVEGTENFITLLNNAGITIKSYNDLWKFTTFITYIFDYRFTSLIVKSSNQLISGTGSNLYIGEYPNWNITQSSNYTLSAFSGACLDFTRLYDVVLSILYPKQTQFMCIINPVGFEGHAMPVFNVNDSWFLVDYATLVQLDNPLSAYAYYRSTYLNNATIDADISLSTINPYPNNGDSYATIQIYATNKDLYANNIPQNFRILSNPIGSIEWNTITQKAWKYFDILSFPKSANDNQILFWSVLIIAGIIFLSK